MDSLDKELTELEFNVQISNSIEYYTKMIENYWTVIEKAQAMRNGLINLYQEYLEQKKTNFLRFKITKDNIIEFEIDRPIGEPIKETSKKKKR